MVNIVLISTIIPIVNFLRKIKNKNMSLETQVMESMKIAMRAKDATTLTALRGIKAAFQKLDTSGDTVTEDTRLLALQKMIKERNEAADIYKANNRNDLYTIEVSEISVIEKFLPTQLSDAEVEVEVKSAIAETGATTIREMGKVMAILSKTLVGKASNKVISDTVKKLLV
jgi:hypothetical protein